MTKFYFAAILIQISIGYQLLGNTRADSLSTQVNKTISNKNNYVNDKLEQLHSLHQVLNDKLTNEKRFEVLQRLSNEYKTFIYDSAFSNISKMQQLSYHLKDSIKIAYSKTQLGFVLLSSGMFKETLDSLSNLNVTGMPDSIKIDYYFVLARAYYDLGDFDKDRYYTPKYNTLGSRYIDSARNLCKRDSYTYLYLTGLKNLKNENSDDAFLNLNTLLTKHRLSAHEIAVTSSTLSYYYISRNEVDEAINLLALAAISDIQTSTKETAAMSSLAELLYGKGDITNAYTYIQQAMEDAIFYGARQRKVQVGSILPIIASAKLNNVEEQRKLWLNYSSLITILTILVLVFAVIIFKQLNKRKIAERALQEANKIKEEYIGY